MIDARRRDAVWWRKRRTCYAMMHTETDAEARVEHECVAGTEKRMLCDN